MLQRHESRVAIGIRVWHCRYNLIYETSINQIIAHTTLMHPSKICIHSCKHNMHTHIVHHPGDVGGSHALDSLHQRLSLGLPGLLLRVYDWLVVVVGDMCLVDQPPVNMI